MSKNVPEIRFEGFNGDWEENYLSNYMDFSNGINADKESYGKGRKMISVMDILDERPIKYDAIRNSVEVSNLVEEKSKVEYGDLIFVRSSEVIEEVGLSKGYRDDKYALYSGFSIRGKRKTEYDPLFMELSLNYRNRKQIERKAGGSTRFNVSQSILNSLELSLPTIDEQTKIGKFFKRLDERITIANQELARLKETKQGFLQKMFPKEGEIVPEIRFDGFDEEWINYYLLDVAEYKNGKAHENDIDEKGEYVVINSKFVSTNGKIRKYSNHLIEPMNKNDIAFVLSDVPNGRAIARTYIVKKNKVYSLNQRVAGIKPKEITHPYFLFFLMNRHHYFLRFDNGVGQTNLSKGDVEKFHERYPSLKEQTAIGNFFKKLDDTIALQEKELELLKETKKGFLQKMFI